MKQTVFDRRLARHYDELKWLYQELYHDERAFDYFADMLRRCWRDRKKPLRDQDAKRESDPDWYRRRDLLGMMLYVDAFAGNLNGVKEKPELHQGVRGELPPSDASAGQSQGPQRRGYAVSDFRTVQPQLGTMEDLEKLADACRRQKLSLCLDFVMNHTSEDHEWAKKARAGEPGYRERYFFYDSWDIPRSLRRPSPRYSPPPPQAALPSWRTGRSS